MSTIVKIVIFSLILTIIGLVVFQFIDPNIQKAVSDSITSADENSLYVSISGEINHVGSYYIANETKLSDLIATAGGVTTNADYLCFDEELTLIANGSYYIAPLYDNSNVCSTAKLTKYNINTCAVEDLEKINGIGSSIATNVINHRNEVGSFKQLEDIMNVNGIGSSTFSKMKNFIRLKDEQ
jgi:competence protein ComEA